MKTPNFTPLILGGIIGITTLACFLLSKNEQSSPMIPTTNPTGDIHIQIPTDASQPTEDVPTVTVPNIEDVELPTKPSLPALEDREDEQIKDSPEEVVNPDGEGIDTEKGKDEKQEVTVEKETVTVVEGKGDVHENKDKPNPNGDESNKNAPEYQSPAGGDNPFDNDIETEIEDTPVEDLIGDGDDRPGEGVHF